MKKVLILAPHQDDELILCGSFLKELIEQSEVYIVYTTNGNYEASVHTIRMEEALEVCSLYGLAEERVIYLGYANEYEAKGPHIYNAAIGQIVSSQYGISETYGLPSHPEYCYKKHGVHHSYTRDNMKQDLLEVIKEIMPDIIFATDIEIHPDHKCNSLLLDEVLGEILHEMLDYNPIVLKKPGYMTSWFADEDYNFINNPSSELNHSVVNTNGHRSVFDNPYMKWADRIRIPVGHSTYAYERKDNILYKALKMYESQNVESHFEMMQNSDVVFWQRRTDSLSYGAKVVTTSGNASYLNDFKVVDSLDIRRRDTDSWDVDASIWRPDINDKERRIEFYFDNSEFISEIDIYQEFYPESRIIDAHLVINNKVITIDKIQHDGVTKIKIKPVKTDKLVIVIDSVSNENIAPGISEIEVYKDFKPQLLFAKIMNRDNFIYDYYVKEDENIKLQVYEFWSDGSTKINSLDDYNVEYIQEKDGKTVFIKNKIVGKIDNEYEVLIKHRQFDYITDRIKLIPSEFIPKQYKMNNYFDKAKNLITNLVNEEEGIYKGKTADMIASFSFGEKRNGMGQYVKDFLRGYLDKSSKKISRNHRKVFFLGAPDHGNVGDHAITIATYALLHDVLGNVEIEEVPIMQFARKLPYLINNIGKDDLIVLQGGGNMGNIYWRNERIRREVITRFPDNIKIIFPETIYYENNEEGRNDFSLSKKVYRDYNTHVFARERKSYEIMTKSYPECHIYLVPDIVCYLSPYSVSEKREGVGLCFRNDLEKGINESLENIIIADLSKSGIKYKYMDMMYNSKGYIGKANRERIVTQKVREISSFEFVITDRLHGMILSYITGTPCIVISKYNHKIESFYYTWFDKVDYIEFVDDESDISVAIERVSAMKNKKAKAMDYRKLINLLEEWK